MYLDGEAYAPRDPREAARRGVAFIHQELNLFSNLSIAENIFISDMPRRPGGLIDRPALHHRTAALLREVELDVSPETLVERLSPGERQLVERLVALHRELLANSQSAELLLAQGLTEITRAAAAAERKR